MRVSEKRVCVRGRESESEREEERASKPFLLPQINSSWLSSKIRTCDSAGRHRDLSFGRSLLLLFMSQQFSSKLSIAIVGSEQGGF